VYCELYITLETIFRHDRIFNSLGHSEPSSNVTHDCPLPLLTILVLQYRSQIQRLGYILDFPDAITQVKHKIAAFEDISDVRFNYLVNEEPEPNPYFDECESP
jgi:hypothetical protein